MQIDFENNELTQSDRIAAPTRERGAWKKFTPISCVFLRAFLDKTGCVT